MKKFISPAKPLQSFKVPLFWGCKDRRFTTLETWLSALHDEMLVPCNGKAPRQKIEGLSKTFEAPRLREDEDWKAYFRYLAFLEIWSKI